MYRIVNTEKEVCRFCMEDEASQEECIINADQAGEYNFYELTPIKEFLS